MSAVYLYRRTRATLACLGLAFVLCLFLLGPSLAQTTHDAAAIKVRDLVFHSLQGGEIAIYALEQEELVHIKTLASGEGGFIRGVVFHGLARERKRQGVDIEAPFRLTGDGGTRLILEDTFTGETVNLRAFGPLNAQSFAALLGAETSAQ